MSSAARRLIGHDQARAHREHARDPDAALLASGKLRGEVRELAVLETHLAPEARGCGPRFSASLGRSCTVSASRRISRTRISGFKSRVEVLEDHLHLAPQRAQLGAAQCGDVAPSNTMRPLLGSVSRSAGLEPPSARVAPGPQGALLAVPCSGESMEPHHSRGHRSAQGLQPASRPDCPC